ncbi:phage portal protein, partial [Candidatus Pacearchaeota archaeon]|nr:phage portal protein [Candidatus Pacearchaeota archaeon]
MFKRIKLLFSKISQKDFGSGGDGFGTSVFERVTNFLFGGSQKKYVNQYKGWVFACVDAASKEVGNIKLELFKRKANGEVEQIFQSPVLDLLFKVNSTTTFFQLMQATEAFLELTGNAYWWIRDNKEIQMLHPSTTYFVLDSDDISLENIPKIKEWVTKVAINGRVRTLRIPAEKVIAFKAFNPMSETLIPSKGMGTVEAAIISIQQDVQSNLWNLNFFKNSARPDLALEAEGVIPKEQKEKLRKAWEQEFKGTSKSHRVAILE